MSGLVVVAVIGLLATAAAWAADRWELACVDRMFGGHQ